MSTSANFPDTSRIPGRAGGRSRRRSRRRCRPRCCRRRCTRGFARARTTPSPSASCRRCASSSVDTRSRRRDRNGMDSTHDSPSGRLGRGHRAPPCAMVIFGASGDLTKRLLMPGLYNLARARRLSERFAIIGIDRSQWSEEDFRAHLAEGVRSFVSDTGGAGPASEAFDPDTWDFIATRMTHIDGDATSPELYGDLKKGLAEVEKEFGTAGNVIFYLAVAP